ncbi:MAG: biosynthetic-type acetolactate synthase large subunit [Burkholderiales bacterium]|nr:biosynthetic-type acetolactate synthase large subunit [Burkholderiales bacterium]MBL6879134.1 biosynthetic-type acetolactate synthase large subunit [Burkholderiales bacterium]
MKILTTTPVAATTGSQQTPPRSGASALVETLVHLGVDKVFGYPGGAVLPIYDALYNEKRLHHILVRHEQAAVHAAEGYARSTGKPGVVVVTSGPGMSNTTTGLLDAMSDSIPIICISGQVAKPLIGTQAFQECDAIGIAKTVTKWQTQIQDVREVVQRTEEAYNRAVSGRPSPVLIDFPKDIQAQLIDSPIGVSLRKTPKDSTPSEYNISQAINLILEAKKPIIYGGGGLINSGNLACDTFAKLVSMTKAPCTLTLMGLGAFPGSHPQFIGMPGMHGTLEANLALHDSDLIVCVGARFDDRVTGDVETFAPNSKKIHIDIDPNSINRLVPVDVGLAGDCGDVLSKIVPILRAKINTLQDIQPWWAKIHRWQKVKSLNFETKENTIVPQALIRSIQNATAGEDPIIATDVGQHQMWAAQHFVFNKPGHWLTSGGAGTMGYGLPAAIGAQLAHPDKTVICVSGDASILMNIQELSTAVQHKTPVKIILSNNECMGMVRQWQEFNHGGRYSHSYTEALPDFVSVAKGFGWAAERISNPDELDTAVMRCLRHDGPYFLEVAVEKQENCFPMMPAGVPHNQILLREGEFYKDDST